MIEIVGYDDHNSAVDAVRAFQRAAQQDNAVSGLVPYSGTINWRGDTLAGRTPAAIARGGIVQCSETRELFGDMSVRENLDLGGQHLAVAETTKQRNWLFGLFPILQARQGQAASTVSGGEQQMLAIARALMMQPKLLALDEPTLGLAPVILEQLCTAMETLRQTTDITMLLGEQNVTFALPHAEWKLSNSPTRIFAHPEKGQDLRFIGWDQRRNRKPAWSNSWHTGNQNKQTSTAPAPRPDAPRLPFQ